MLDRTPRRLIAIALALLCSACASQQVGTVAGNVVGGTAWVAMKGGAAVFKGGRFAVKTTARTVKGAANGVHEEFSRPGGAPSRTAQAKAAPQSVAALSD